MKLAEATFIFCSKITIHIKQGDFKNLILQKQKIICPNAALDIEFLSGHLPMRRVD